MWLVFVLLILIILRIGLFFSKIKVSIKHINISENKFELDVRISLYIFYKLKVLTIICNELGIKIGNVFIKYEKIIKSFNTEEFMKKTFKPVSLNRIRELNLFLENMHINCQIGTEDLFITVGSVTIISAILGFIVCKYKKQMHNCKYRIMPAFGKNILSFNGDLSLSFKTRRIGIFLSPKEHTKFKILVGG